MAQTNKSFRILVSLSYIQSDSLVFAANYFQVYIFFWSTPLYWHIKEQYNLNYAKYRYGRDYQAYKNVKSNYEKNQFMNDDTDKSLP